MIVTERKTGGRERRVLIGMVVDKVVLAEVAAKWNQDGLFSSLWCNLVGDWCVDYWNRYSRPPGKDVEALFQAWAERSKDKDTVTLVERFLGELSGEYVRLRKEMNSQQVLDLAKEHFNHVRYSKLAETIQGAVQAGRIDQADQVMNKFQKVEIGTGGWIDVLNDRNALARMFKRAEEPALIDLPGDLGKFFGKSLARDNFVSFMGPEKRGKCVSGDQEVLLADGRVLTIQEIVQSKNRTPVMSLDERTGTFVPMDVAEFWDNGVKPVYELTTKSGRKVQTTGNHKYLTPGGWKYQDSIRPGEFVAVPKRVSVFGTHEVDESLVKFLAYMVAEGCCLPTQPTFTNTDREMVDDFHGCCDALGIRWTRKGISTALAGSNQLLRDHGLWGKLSKVKDVPEVVFTLRKEAVSLFLRILFSCDGCIYKDRGKRKVELTLASERLVRQVSHLLLRFGVVCSVAGYVLKKDGKEFPAWRLVIGSSEYVNLFLEEINFISSKRTEPESVVSRRSFLDRVPYEVVRRLWDEVKKDGRGGLSLVFKDRVALIREQLRLRRPMMRQAFYGLDDPRVRAVLDTEVLWDEVVSITPAGERQTYDLSIPDRHNFIANDVVVHNTWWLLHLAWAGLLTRKRVAFFEIGDLSEEQIMERFATRACGRPIDNEEWPLTVRWPTGITKSDFDVQVQFEDRTFKAAPTEEEVWKAQQKFLRDRVKSKETLLRLSVHPNSTLTVAAMRSMLLTEQRKGWPVDAVFVDYADILAPPPGFQGDSREATNENWKQLRRLSQELHCLVVTATQTKATSYAAKGLDMTHFSEDKRKFAHVTAMVGINQDEDEKESEVQRLNFVVRREKRFVTKRYVHVAGCLTLGNPAVRSVM